MVTWHCTSNPLETPCASFSMRRSTPIINWLPRSDYIELGLLVKVCYISHLWSEVNARLIVALCRSSASSSLFTSSLLKGHFKARSPSRFIACRFFPGSRRVLSSTSSDKHCAIAAVRVWNVGSFAVSWPSAKSFTLFRTPWRALTSLLRLSISFLASLTSKAYFPHKVNISFDIWTTVITLAALLSGSIGTCKNGLADGRSNTFSQGVKFVMWKTWALGCGSAGLCVDTQVRGWDAGWDDRILYLASTQVTLPSKPFWLKLWDFTPIRKASSAFLRSFRSCYRALQLRQTIADGASKLSSAQRVQSSLDTLLSLPLQQHPYHSDIERIFYSLCSHQLSMHVVCPLKAFSLANRWYVPKSCGWLRQSRGNTAEIKPKLPAQLSPRL